MKTKRIIAFLCLVIVFISLQAVGVHANAKATTYPTLRVGSRGSSVVRLQAALKEKGFLNGRADGRYGLATRSAVIRFQRANKLKADGIAGSQTQIKLYTPKANAVKPSTTTIASRGTSMTTTSSPAPTVKSANTANAASTINAASTTNLTDSINETDLYWLARIIHAEAEGEPYQGKLAVGNVVMNRVQSSLFPNTVKGVIFDYFNTIPQFSPVADGTIYNTPNQDSIKAAREALNGAKPVADCMYFFNPDKSEGTWIVRNKTYYTRIGNHVFYR